MELALAFIVAAVISFFGSVLLGLVNVAVIDTAITKSEKSALWLALGGVLPEIPYTFIAILGTSYIDKLETYKHHIGIGVGLLFIIIGLGYFFKKTKSLEHKDINEVGAFAHFTKGLLLALANPQLIFFWSTVLVLIQTGTFSGGEPLFHFQSNFIHGVNWAFALGTAFGAFIILFIYTKLSGIYKKQLIGLIGARMSKFIGLLFIGMGLLGIIRNAF